MDKNVKRRSVVIIFFKYMVSGFLVLQKPVARPLQKVTCYLEANDRLEYKSVELAIVKNAVAAKTVIRLCDKFCLG